MRQQPTNIVEPKGWYRSGLLPHFDGGEIAQLVTYRLAGSLPRSVLARYKQQLDQDLISEIEYYDLIDQYLDGGRGADFLKQPPVALIIEENLFRFHQDKYELYAWVIMSNHAHVLFRPLGGISLASIMHSLRSYTANKANGILARTGPFWARDYFDRYIRNEDHFFKAAEYIHNNPVKAKLCSRPQDWPFSSAHRTTW